MRSLPPKDYRLLPPHEPPAGYICLVRDEEYRDRFAILRAQDPTDIDDYLKSFAFRIRIEKIFRLEDGVASIERDLRNRYAGSEEWFTLSHAQLQEIDALVRPSIRHRTQVAQSPSQRWRRLVNVILVALISFIAVSMLQEATGTFNGILELVVRSTPTRTLTPTDRPTHTTVPTDIATAADRPTNTPAPTNTPIPTDRPTNTPAPTNTPTDIPLTATNTDTPTDVPPTAAIYVVDTARNQNANIRVCPRMSCQIIANLPSGTTIEVLSSTSGESVYESDVWFVIKLAADSAYIHSALAAAPATSQPISSSASPIRFAASSRRYTHSALNLRSGPGTHFPVIDAAPADTALEVVGKSGDWYLIRRGGREIYVAAWLTHDAPALDSRVSAGRGAQASVASGSVEQAATVQASQPQIAPAPVDNCCFIGWQCHTEDDWQSGYIAFQNNQCERSSPQPVQARSPRTSQSSQQNYSCNCSKTCKQMSSCQEAYYQLNDCGCRRRDGDSDGIPCESICG